MPRPVRGLLIGSLIAFHAAVMLYGPCLHGLPGWGHGAGLSAASDGDHVRSPVNAAHSSPDDCPVCHFLAQGQLVDLPACLSEVRQVAALTTEGASDPATPLLPTGTSPRAPPAHAPTLS